MAPASVPDKQSAAEMAANTLWEYQLRRENKAILEQIRKIGEKRDADVSGNMKRLQEGEKRRLALEARVAELEKEQKEQDARAAEHKRECTAKLAEMENFLRGRLTDDELRNIMSGGQHMNTAAQPAMVPEPSRAPGIYSSNSRPRAVIKAGIAARQGANTSKTLAPVREERPVPPPKPKQVTTRHRTTRSNSRDNAAPKAEQVAATPTTSSIPKLAQKHRSLKLYYETANKAFASIDITNPQMEYDFITAFISGFETKKTGTRLLQALQAVHPARNKLDGGIEIMCSWEDIPDGIRGAGLDITGAKEEIKKKKRTLNVRTQLETGFAS